MQHASHSKTAITIVRDHFEDWRRANRWSRETAADMIVQAHERIGGPLNTGIKFEPTTTDTFERMRVNADRIYRWLDDASKDKNLLTLNFLWSILAALPEDRRLHLVDALLAPIGMSAGFFGFDPAVEDSDHSVVLHFQAVVSNGAAVNVAMADMVDGVDPGEPEQAKKSLKTALTAIRRALGFVERLHLRRGKKPCA